MPQTLDDAKRMQRLVAHLVALRRQWHFVQDKRAIVSGLTVCLELEKREVPAKVLEAARNQAHHAGYLDKVHYNCSQDKWRASMPLRHGSIDTDAGATFYGDEGVVPTLGFRLMNIVRAAVTDEIKATEKAIIKLGFVVPSEGVSRGD